MPLADLPGIRMHYEWSGKGPPLLVTAGWSLAERAFSSHRALLDAHFRCLRHDHRGMGRSKAPPGPISVAEMADDLAGLLGHLELPPVRVLGGGGMGALVAMELAIRHPGRVSALLLGSPSLRVDAFLREIMLMWKALRRLDPVLWAREVTFWCYTPRTFEERPELAQGALAARSGEPTFCDADAFDRIVDAYIAYDATESASRIRCPVLVTSGGNEDVITGPRFARAVQAAIPGAALHVFEGTSHNYWIEQPEAFGRLAVGWLGSKG
jgi:3-oxoadipate enol-lactonase